MDPSRRRLIRAAGATVGACLAGVGGLTKAAAAEPHVSGKAPLGLITTPGGVVMHNGRPFRGIGVNYLNAFSRFVQSPETWPGDLERVRWGMEQLVDYGIPFARIMGCGYWPTENRLYFDDKAEYLKRLAAVVAIAEDTGVGLIPSLFWHTSTATDLMDEPRNQWGNPTSRTHKFMRSYVRDVVGTFASSPAIWAWEFGNEYNLDADLPNASDWRPPVVPELGTRLTRDERDDLTHDHIHTAFRAFAHEVRRYDRHRIILSGNAAPRPSAWHQREYLSWDQDSPRQFAEILRYENPDPLDAISIHHYEPAEQRFGREVSAAEFLRECVRESRKARKPLFVGEFGSDEGLGHEEAAARFQQLLDAIVSAEVPLAALWVYDYVGQDGTWNVTPDNGRQYQLEAIGRASRRVATTAVS